MGDAIPRRPALSSIEPVPDFEARLEGVVRFAFAHVRHLDGYARCWIEEQAHRIRLTDKIAAEAAMLLMLGCRVRRPGTSLDEACARLGGALAPLIRSDRLRRLIVRSPQVAATLGSAHVYLTAAGFPDPDFDELIDEALEGGFSDSVERVPYRALDQRWTRNLIASEPARFDDLLVKSILRSPAHPFYMTESDAYAVTHAVMYVTDFGRSHLPSILSRPGVEALVAAGLAWHLVSGDFDLLVEFLICAECLDRREDPAARFAAHVVEQVWRELEFLPGPTFDPERYRALAGFEAAAYAFHHMYHTNFVAGMYAATRLAAADAGNPERPPVAPGECDTGRLEHLLALAINVGGTRASPEAPWFAALDTAPVETADLERLLWDSVAIEAVRQEDWGCVAALAELPGRPDSLTSAELDRLIGRMHRFLGK